MCYGKRVPSSLPLPYASLLKIINTQLETSVTYNTLRYSIEREAELQQLITAPVPPRTRRTARAYGGAA